MSRVLITGSSDGLGLVAAQKLISQGHRVTLHARNQQRASEAQEQAPGAEAVLISDISTVNGMKQLATEANKTGAFDTVLYNAGIGYSQPYKKTEDGVSMVFAVNSLAPYVLTALMDRPKRLVFTSSELHSGGDGSLKDVAWTSGRQWNGFQAYCDSKLHNVIFAFAAARHWADVQSDAVDPGWVQTKMGGSGAPGTADQGADTLTWLASGNGAVSGQLYKARKVSKPHKAAQDVNKQEEFLGICEQLSGVRLPR
ncbi:putative daunorubicin C-13 ketoreductase [Elsinoe ampelina]|uniref:Putative daunorubicin C-13 ketoreductase n=1 Tax=Elsinoe ampelina TaxID=302913 RepID=A0A6A6G8Z2_9PEZI|nr:putative daunorubicin C-13 ketoreductase [Elsinoe ampelina]